jgi:pimeloyl-ACP methyl ester carboxylesterase
MIVDRDPEYSLPRLGGIAAKTVVKTLRFLLLLVAVVAGPSCRKEEIAAKPLPDPPPPAAGGYAEIRGVKLYYQIFGEGPPLLLLHGGLGSSADFAKFVAAFSKDFRIVAFDRRGHGRSFDNAEPYSYADMAEEAKAFLDFLRIDSAFVLGFSDGGVAGYHLAAKYPRMVKKLVAIGANSRVDGMNAEMVEWTKTQLTPETAATVLPDVAASYRSLNPAPENFADFIRKSQALWLRDPYIAAEDLHGIQAPILFIAGESDAVRIEHILEMKTAVKDGHLCVLPNATHFVLMEKPAALHPIILEFLKSPK